MKNLFESVDDKIPQHEMKSDIIGESALKEESPKMAMKDKRKQILSKDGKRTVRIHFCDECSFSSDRQDFLKDHKFTEHEGKLYECDQCEKTCRQMKNMKEHIRMMHSVERVTFLCEFCNYETKWARVLKSHRKTKHNILEQNNDKIFQCENVSFHPIANHRSVIMSNRNILTQDINVLSALFPLKGRET